MNNDKHKRTIENTLSEQVENAGTPDAEEQTMEPSEGLGQLVDDVKILFKYAMETGRVPPGVKSEEIYTICCKTVAQLNEEEVAKIAQYYEKLNKALTPVTARTLKDTDPERYKDGTIGKYLWRLGFLVYVLIGVILFINIVEYYSVYAIESESPGDPLSLLNTVIFLLIKLASFIVPFAYGTLGACAYILRVTESHLRMRSFDAARIPEHKNRLILGSLSGGVIVLFVTDLPGQAKASVTVTQAALGFLAGYSIEMLFEVIDRLIKAILPRVGRSTKEIEKQKKREHALANRLQEKVDRIQEQDQKEMFGDIIDELRG